MQGLRAHCGEWMWGTPGALLASIRAPTLQGTRGAPGYSPFLGAGTPNPRPVGQHPVGWMWGDTGTTASPCSLSLARRTGVGIGQPQHWALLGSIWDGTPGTPCLQQHGRSPRVDRWSLCGLGTAKQPQLAPQLGCLPRAGLQPWPVLFCPAEPH